MARAALFLAFGLALCGQAAGAREAVWASEPQHVSVTIYRDPSRGEDQELDREWPQGFAMISETRTVTLPPGESTIRFDGVAEGMVAVSAIVTGLPGGTIEKNRNADLLSPASLLDGTLGNRITVTRTDRATGAPRSEDAIVRTRADGALVLQTREGYEAVRCAGIPETLTFDRVPEGLSARPVYSIDTRDPAGGTYEIVLTYLSWGFDWQAHYVATFDGPQRDGTERLALHSWLTLLNDNGQGFADAEVMAVAGKLNVVSDYADLADPPDARGLYVQCYPLGSTATGSPVYNDYKDEFVVTGYRSRLMAMAAPAPMVMVDSIVAEDLGKLPQFIAQEEQLGDLKLYRVPEPVTVAAKSLKQVAFLDKDAVQGRLVYRSECTAGSSSGGPEAMTMALRTVNDEEHGLGAALPMGGVTMFEDRPGGELLVGEDWLRDHAAGQDVEIEVAESTQVFADCGATSDVLPHAEGYPWVPMRVALSNANPRPVTVKIGLGHPAQWRVREKLKGLTVEDGYLTLTRIVPANRTVEIDWSIRYFAGEDDVVADGQSDGRATLAALAARD